MGSDRVGSAGRSSSSDLCGELIPVISGRTKERAWSGTLYKAGDIYLQVPGGQVRIRSRRKDASVEAWSAMAVRVCRQPRAESARRACKPRILQRVPGPRSNAGTPQDKSQRPEQ